MPKTFKRVNGGVAVPSEPKQRKRGYKFDRIVHKNQGKPGAVTLGQKFTADERSLWHMVQDFVQENYPCTDPNRKREHIAMVILEAAMTTLNIVVEVPQGAQEPRNDNQLDLPGTNEVEDSEDDSENFDAPLNTEDESDEESTEDAADDSVGTSEEDDEVLPLEETG
jgi:hypothetical protein